MEGSVVWLGPRRGRSLQDCPDWSFPWGGIFGRVRPLPRQSENFVTANPPRPDMPDAPDTGPLLPLVFDEVVVAAGAARLIDGLSFTIEAGARTVILGPNGAGKSLLLRLAHGLVQPTAGQVRWRTDAAPGMRGMVFSRPVMLRRSAAGNIHYALSLAGVRGNQAEDRVAAALNLTGLGKLAGRAAQTLSTGEQQRLAIARAWAPAPQVLLLDEPTANLDPAAADAIEKIIHDIAAEGVKIIMTTHDLGLARRLGEDILLLHHGTLVERAPAERLFDAPESDVARDFLAGRLTW